MKVFSPSCFCFDSMPNKTWQGVSKKIDTMSSQLAERGKLNSRPSMKNWGCCPCAIELHSLTCKQKMEENFMNWAQNWWWSLYNFELILNNLWVLYMEVWFTLECIMHLIDKFPRRADANASQKLTSNVI